METRRNFLKKVGLMGITGVVPLKDLNLHPKNEFQGLYGSDFIKQVLRAYKKEMPVTYRSRYGSGNPVIASLENETKLSYGCLGSSYLNGLNPLSISQWRNDNYDLRILRNEKDLCYVEFLASRLEFREEEETLFSCLRGDAIMPLPNSEEYFEPFKELYNLVWKDVKLYIKNK
ncbi:hypothetical protein KAT36_04150 [Candidatus Pacearchaeota archaeon]|nr:hypothetical protein [Candidatus Pacearchaeota archaeon]